MSTPDLIPADVKGTESGKSVRKSFLVVVSVVLAVVVTFFPVGPVSVIFPKPVSEIIFGEQCTPMWIKRNLTALKLSLDDQLFGQHIAKKLVLSSLYKRWEDPNYSPSKPLVMSFHGWTGGGKNYAAKMIAEAMFSKGLSSKSVTLLASTLHFHDKKKVVEYTSLLQQWVRGNVSRCPESLFIIDEVDKMPPGVLDGLKAYMDFHDVVDGVDYRRAVFILLSNTGGREITEVAFKFWEEGKARETMAYKDLDSLVSKGAFNEEGGLRKASLIDRNLIDVYVPFLPLQLKHVKFCVEKELSKRQIESYLIPSLVERVIQELPFWPKDEPLFAASGCKRVLQKVDELLYDI